MFFNVASGTQTNKKDSKTGKMKDFEWQKYLKETNSQFVPAEFFDKGVKANNMFEVGMKLESVDLMEPKIVCVATVVAVASHLIRIHFDGWDNSYDQWIDCQSCDIYPIGWCELVGYTLTPPRVLAKPALAETELLATTSAKKPRKYNKKK